MERYAFIHGSSVGQSTYIPSNAPKGVCSEIADRYFKGRELRCKESDAGMALFVELCKNSQGSSFICYSFVNNNCVGATEKKDEEGRQGQYFAISVISQEYVFPEPVYNLLLQAYKQLFEGKIIDKDGKFLIAQFDEKKDDFQNAVSQIDRFFTEFSQGKPLKNGSRQADFNSWKGERINLDTCNSEHAFDTLCKLGRIYISQEYESPNAKIKSLEIKVSELQSEKAEMEERINKAKITERNKNKEEIDGLAIKLKEKEAESKRLQTENDRFKESIGIVRSELDKIEKSNKEIHSLRGKASNDYEKGKKDIVKLLLLTLVLVFTLISGILSYTFFRNLSSDIEKIKTKIENVKNVPEVPTKQPEVKPDPGSVEQPQVPEETSETLSLTISKLDFEAAGSSKDIIVTSSESWDYEKSNIPKWLTLTKKENKLTVKAIANATNDQRNYTFMVRSGDLEKQVTISQKGREKVEKPEKPDFGMVIKDSKGNVLKAGSKVTRGQKLTASVSKPSSADGVGWTFDGCSGNNNGQNWAEVQVTVSAESGTIAIGYGPKNDKSKRQIISFQVEVKKVDEEKPPQTEQKYESTTEEVQELDKKKDTIQ